MKKRILKKWVKNWLCIESVILFSFVAMVNDFTFLGFFIILGILLKLFIMDLIIKILFQYIVIAIYTLFRKNISIFFSFITPLTALLKINSGKIFFAYNNNMYILLLILILITIFTYWILKLKIINLFERSEKNEI